MEIARSGGLVRMVELQGTLEEIEVAIEMVLSAFETFPEGAPGSVRLWVSAATADMLRTRGSRAIGEICDNTGVSIDLVEGGHADNSSFLVVAGDKQAMLEATQLVAANLVELSSCEGAPAEKPSAGHGSSSPFAEREVAPPQRAAPGLARGRGAAMQTRDQAAATLVRDRGGCGSRDVPEVHQAAGGQAAPVAPPRDAVGLDPGFLQAASSVRTPSEARLLQGLLAGPQANRAQLQLMLPLELVRGLLAAEGRLAAIASRSGSKLTLGAEHASPATQLLTITGTMLGNAMAVLHLQELLQQHGLV